MRTGPVCPSSTFRGLVLMSRPESGIVRTAKKRVSRHRERSRRRCGRVGSARDGTSRDPRPDGAVVRAREELPVALAHRQRQHGTGMLLEHVHASSSLRVPHRMVLSAEALKRCPAVASAHTISSCPSSTQCGTRGAHHAILARHAVHTAFSITLVN